MAYKKIFQIFRSTNIWPTKNIAKAMVEINAKHLHTTPETASVKDGEPIVARYYNALENYTFSYTQITGTGELDPYKGANSANHIWVAGFDDLEALPNAADVNADSAAFIRVPNGSEGYNYYQLEANAGTGASEEGVNTIYGVVFLGKEHVDDANDKMYIEWFDSAADAQGIIDGLNYVDNNIGYDFVAKVNQKNGKIEPIHGTISSKQAIKLTEANYAYVKLGSQPSEWAASSETEGTTLPTASAANAPRYFHVVHTPAESADGWYELRKDIDIHLQIADSNNILAQGPSYRPIAALPSGETATNVTEVPEFPETDAAQYIYDTVHEQYYELIDNRGLGTHLTLRALDANEIGQLPNASNIRDAYKLVGNANGTETIIGDVIKIWKDQSLYKVYLGHVDDQINESTGAITPGTGNDALCFVYMIADGSYSLVAVDVEEFLMENEFKDGLEIIRGTYTYEEIEKTSVPIGWVWDENNSGPELPSSVVSTSPAYFKVIDGTDETFYKLCSNGTVQVKLSTIGGLKMYDEGTGVNQSVGIKLDSGNTFYRPIRSGETATHAKHNMYEWINGSTKYYTDTYQPTTSSAVYTTSNNLLYTVVDNTNPTAVNRTFFSQGTITVGGSVYTANGVVTDGYVADANGGYIMGTYLYVNGDGLGIDIENKISNEIQKIRINGQGLEKVGGVYQTTLTGNDIKMAEESDTVPTIIESAPANTKGIYAYDGNIYIADGTSYHAFTKNDVPNLSAAEMAMINLYLNYNLDMGTYTIV